MDSDGRSVWTQNANAYGLDAGADSFLLETRAAIPVDRDKPFADSLQSMAHIQEQILEIVGTLKRNQAAAHTEVLAKLEHLQEDRRFRSTRYADVGTGNLGTARRRRQSIGGATGEGGSGHSGRRTSGALSTTAPDQEERLGMKASVESCAGAGAGAQESFAISPFCQLAQSLGSSSTAYSRKGRMHLRDKSKDLPLSNQLTNTARYAIPGRAWSPDSKSRAVYDVLSTLAVLFEAFIVPISLAWQLPEAGMLFVSTWVMRAYWALDLVLSFLTGYRDEEARLELRLKRSARHFFRTWFFADFALVVWDWISIAAGTPTIIRLMNGLRIVRQVVRISALFEKAKLEMLTQEAHLSMNISVVLLFIIWLCHVVCCIWYFLGSSGGGDFGITWLDNEPLAQKSSVNSYMSALHWSLAQLGNGSNEVVPTTTGELLFAVFVLFVGLVVGSTLIALLSSITTRYELMLEESARKFRELQQYLKQQAVDPDVAMVVKMQVMARKKEKQRLRMRDVEYLSMVSKSLRKMVKTYDCKKHLSVHVFWNSWGQIDWACMMDFCSRAMEYVEYMPDDLVYDEGTSGTVMYLVIRGKLRYLPGDMAPERDWFESDERLLLEAGAWNSEVSLWTVWTHLGVLASGATSEVLAINLSEWKRDLHRYPLPLGVLAEYGAVFHRHMNDVGVSPSDLVHDVDYHELVWCLPRESRSVLSIPVFDLLEGQQTTTNFLSDLGRSPRVGHILKLQSEVANGKCNVGLVSGEVVRTVFVIALRICRRSSLRRIRSSDSCTQKGSFESNEGFRPRSSNSSSGSASDSRNHGILSRSRSTPLGASGSLPYAAGSSDASDLDTGAALKSAKLFLIKVGELSRNGTPVAASCILPGTKRREQESSTAAMRRVLDGELAEADHHVSMSLDQDVEHTVTIKESAKYGIRTRYLRTTFQGEWIGPEPKLLPAPAVLPGPLPAQRNSDRSLSFASVRGSAYARRVALEIQMQAVDVLAAAEGLHFILNDSSGEANFDLYLWLEQREFDVLSHEDAQPVLDHWLATVDRTKMEWI